MSVGSESVCAREACQRRREPMPTCEPNIDQWIIYHDGGSHHAIQFGQRPCIAASHRGPVSYARRVVDPRDELSLHHPASDAKCDSEHMVVAAPLAEPCRSCVLRAQPTQHLRQVRRAENNRMEGTRERSGGLVCHGGGGGGNTPARSQDIGAWLGCLHEHAFTRSRVVGAPL